MNVLADASLPGLDLAFPEPFHLTKYSHPDEIVHLLPGQDVLFCRSTLKVNQALLQHHRVQYVATASSGIDHLDHRWLESQHIQIIDAKGSNARSVADYVLACLACLIQQNRISGKKAGIIGMGKVGTQVAARLQALQFQTFNYDPLKALNDPISFSTCALADLYQADVLCIHAQLHEMAPYPSANLVNKAFLDQLKPGCVIINAARGGIISEEDLLRTHTPLIYCTDVYCNEPNIDPRIVEKALLCTPHIAGHSLEAKYAAVSMISEELHRLAGLQTPRFAVPECADRPKLKPHVAWHESVLELYNPLLETVDLKQAVDKKTAFLTLRKNHQKRHDFSLYCNDLNLDYETSLTLGLFKTDA